jgi:Family of unknown function (DUF6544)
MHTVKEHKEISELFRSSRKTAGDQGIKDVYHSLPEPVKEYLTFSQIMDVKPVQTVRIQYEGLFRASVRQNWKAIQCEQYITVNPPGFFWSGILLPRGIFPTITKETYIRGKGSVLIKKQPFSTKVNASGPEVSSRCLTRFLGEMAWYPSALANPYVRWEPLDDASAKADIKYGGRDGSLFFYFNPENELIQAVGVSHRMEKNTPVLENWSIAFGKYGELNGVNIPLSFEATWNLKMSDFGYLKGDVTAIEYNRSEPF